MMSDFDFYPSNLCCCCICKLISESVSYHHHITNVSHEGLKEGSIQSMINRISLVREAGKPCSLSLSLSLCWLVHCKKLLKLHSETIPCIDETALFPKGTFQYLRFHSRLKQMKLQQRLG